MIRMLKTILRKYFQYNFVWQDQNQHNEMEKSQTSLHKAFYNGGVVDIPQDYHHHHHHDPGLLGDGSVKLSSQDSVPVDTLVNQDKTVKPVKTCRGCLRRWVWKLCLQATAAVASKEKYNFVLIVALKNLDFTSSRKKMSSKKSSPGSWKHDYQRVDRFFLLFLPFLFLVFNMFYWGYFLMWDWWYKDLDDLDWLLFSDSCDLWCLCCCLNIVWSLKFSTFLVSDWKIHETLKINNTDHFFFNSLVHFPVISIWVHTYYKYRKQGWTEDDVIKSYKTHKRHVANLQKC